MAQKQQNISLPWIPSSHNYTSQRPFRLIFAFSLPTRASYLLREKPVHAWVNTIKRIKYRTNAILVNAILLTRDRNTSRRFRGNAPHRRLNTTRTNDRDDLQPDAKTGVHFCLFVCLFIYVFISNDLFQHGKRSANNSPRYITVRIF